MHIGFEAYAFAHGVCDCLATIGTCQRTAQNFSYIHFAAFEQAGPQHAIGGERRRLHVEQKGSDIALMKPILP